VNSGKMKYIKVLKQDSRNRTVVLWLQLDLSASVRNNSHVCLQNAAVGLVVMVVWIIFRIRIRKPGVTKSSIV